MRLFRQHLIFFISFFILFEVSANSDFMACYQEFDLPESLFQREFQKIDCGDEGHRTVYLYGESHNEEVEPASAAARWMTASRSMENGLIGFYEGVFSEGAGGRIGSAIGIEGEFRHITNLRMFSTTLAASAARKYHEKGSEAFDNLVRFRNFLFDALKTMKRKEFLWDRVIKKYPVHDLNRDVIDSLTDWLDGNMSYKEYKLINTEGLIELEMDLYAEYYEDYNKVVGFFLIEYLQDLQKQEFFSAISSDVMSDEALELRELEWIQKIKPFLCTKKNDTRPIWIHIGSGHRDRMECALSAIVDSLTVKTPTYYEIEKRLSLWVESFDFSQASEIEAIFDNLSIGPSFEDFELKAMPYHIELRTDTPIESHDISIIKNRLHDYFAAKGVIVRAFPLEGGQIHFRFGPSDLMGIELSYFNQLYNWWQQR